MTGLLYTSALSTTGTRLTKQMIVVPINNTLLYVEPIYQTMLNESEVPILRKVIVASGNKVATVSYTHLIYKLQI